MSSLTSNTIFSTISFGLRFLSNAFLLILVARFLGAVEFGKFALSLSLTGIFLIVIDYGFNLYLVKEIAIANNAAISIANKVIPAKNLLTFIATLLLIVVTYGLGYNHSIKLLIAILWIGYIFYSYGLFFNNLFRGLNQFQYEMYPTIVLNLLQFVTVGTLLVVSPGTLPIAWAFTMSRIAYFIYSLFLLRSRVGAPKLICRLNRNSIAPILNTFPYGIHAILGVLYFQLDTVILSRFVLTSEIGNYQAAMRIVVASMVIFEILTASFFPLAAVKSKTDFNGFKSDISVLNNYLLLIGGLISFSVIVFADIVIHTLYGTAYSGAITTLRLLSVIIFLRFLGGAYGVAMTVSDNQRLRALGVASSVIISLIVNLILIPRYGIIGAAVASIITHIFLNALYLYFTYRTLGTLFIQKKSIIICLILFTAASIAWIFRTISLNISITVFVLFSSVAILVAVGEKDAIAFKMLLHRKLYKQSKS